MNHTIHSLNGLQIITIPMADASSVTIEILVKAGSMMETKQTNGLSHFLEHMFFKGGKRYPTPKSVAVALDTLGADYNAFTSEEYAGYYVKCAPMFTSQAIDVLSDMLVNAQFAHEELEREKGVIVQEIMMYEDMPNRLVVDKRRNRYYGDTSYGRSILGPVENVNRFTHEDLVAHKEGLYTKDNLVIVVAGKIQDEQAILDQITDQFADIAEKKIIEAEKFIHTLPSEYQAHHEKGTQQHHLIIGSPGVDMYDDRRYAATMFAKVLGGTMSSRLFQHIREQRGLCYYIGASHQSASITGTMMIYAGMEKARRDDGLQAIGDELTTIRDQGITDLEYEQVRKNIQGSTQMSIETSDDMASFVGRQALFRDEIVSLETVLERYMAVSKEEIDTMATMVDTGSRYAYWIE